MNSRISQFENNAAGWQYLSEGKYPKECEDVLCYYTGPDLKFCCIGHMIIGGDNKVRWWGNGGEELHVIAWQKIILPETKEEADDN